jgi:hypothetical protein
LVNPKEMLIFAYVKQIKIINNMEKMYVVLMEHISGFERIYFELEIFKEKEKVSAKDYFNDLVKKVKDDYVILDFVIEEEENIFSAYEDGRYIENHIDVELIEKEIH